MGVRTIEDTPMSKEWENLLDLYSKVSIDPDRTYPFESQLLMATMELTLRQAEEIKTLQESLENIKRTMGVSRELIGVTLDEDNR